MPAAMMHADGGVPFMKMTKFASLDANTKNMNRKNESKPRLPHNHIHNKQQHKISSKNNHDSQLPAPSNKLTAEIQYFQMRKMDQR